MPPPPDPISEPCELLDWDSRFFGVAIARVAGDRLDGLSAEAIDDWCLRRGVELTYFLASSDDATTVRTAESFGYRLTDVRMTLEYKDRARSAAAISTTVRSAVAEDLPHLQDVARVSHTDSRFYYDGRLPRTRCDELFAAWVTNSVNGYAAAVLVSGTVGQPTGYVTCHIDPAVGEGSIGLIAVAAEAQGAGVGSRLVDEAVHWLHQQGMQRISVVTQGRNIPAQRLYARCGFVPRSLQLYYHKWFSPQASVVAP